MASKFLFIKKYFKSIYLVIVVLFAITFIFITKKIYEITLDDAKRNHQLQQFEMVNAVAQGVDFFFEHLTNDLKAFSKEFHNELINSHQNKILKKIFRSTDRKYISNVMVITSKPTIKYESVNKVYYDLTNIVLDKKIDLVIEENGFLISDVFFAKIFNNKNENIFLIIYPLQNNKKGKKYLAFEINFNSIINRFVEKLSLSNNDFIWIIDGKGKLIYHPKHEEMLFNSVYDKEADCYECHISFTAQQNMLQKQVPAFDEYSTIKGSQKRIYAYMPIKFGNLKWYLSISTVLEDVTKQLTKRFQLFFLLGIVIFFTIIFFMIIIYYLNIQKMKVEETNKSLKKIHEYQEQLDHTSRLASIGQLVDNVAHEINTPLGIITAHLDSINLLKNNININEELKLIKKQTIRISDYVGSLLYFSKRMSSTPEEMDVRKIADECIFLLNHKLKEKRIKVIRIFENKEVKLLGDKRQLEQIFINLLNNSIDAVNYSGEITISIHNYFNKLDDTNVSRFIKIDIIDNGIGIKDEYKDKIFDAFFTTKEKNGTGLGLSIIKTCIQNLGGSINFESQFGKGTKFSIMIPGDSSYE